MGILRIRQPSLRRRGLRTAILALLVLPACGCSYRYVDADGTQHVIGFVDIAVPQAADERPIAGDIVQLTTIGIAFSRTAQGGMLSLGFTQEKAGVLRDDSLILGDPFGARLALREILPNRNPEGNQ